MPLHRILHAGSLFAEGKYNRFFARDNATKLEYKKSILRQQFSAERPNQRLVSDVICFKLGGHYSYICVAIGLFSHRVIAYKIRKKQHTTHHSHL